jgi:lipid-A-disaccharide synthase
MQSGPGKSSQLRVAIVAAEASGDVLGAGLIAAIRAHRPDAAFFGVAGPRMRAAGCEAWYQAEDISVMGLAEVLPHLVRLLRLRRELTAAIIAGRPDVFVGVDSPAFNLPLERRLKQALIPTVQYVSPQVWAWRQSRVHEIRKSCDRVLCLLPFEPAFFAEHGVPASFVGHPLADEIPAESDPVPARDDLGLAADRPVLALLPGSRGGEVARLARPFLETAAWLEPRVAGLQTVVAVANERVAARIRDAVAAVPLAAAPVLATGRARDVLTAADAVLTASGTAALETMLVKRPMVVAYRLAPLTYALIRRLGIARLPHYSLPNLLAGREVAREFVQGQVRADVLGPAVADCLAGHPPAADWRDVFAAVHRSLQGGGSHAAAREVIAVAAAAAQ